MRMLRGSAISYDWYKSAEGQGLLAHLTDPATGYRHDNIISSAANRLIGEVNNHGEGPY